MTRPILILVVAVLGCNGTQSLVPSQIVENQAKISSDSPSDPKDQAPPGSFDGTASDLSHEACNSGNMTACWGLGQIYELGNETRLPEPKKAESIYKKACEVQHYKSCVSLGWMYLYGASMSITEDPEQAKHLFEKACDSGMMLGCYSLAQAYDRGSNLPWGATGLPEDDERAVELYRKSCDGEHFDACLRLGKKYEEGHEVTQSSVKARDLYTVACNAGLGEACWQYGSLEMDSEYGFKHGLTMYERACELGYERGNEGCYILGLMYYLGSEEIGNVGQNLPKAASAFEKACQNDNTDGCFKLAQMLEGGRGIAKDTKRSLVLYEMSCTEPNLHGGEACYRLGEIYHSGIAGIPANLTLASQRYTNGCDLLDEHSCYELGLMYRAGHVVPLDAVRAKRLITQACQTHQEIRAPLNALASAIDTPGDHRVSVNGFPYVCEQAEPTEIPTASFGKPIGENQEEPGIAVIEMAGSTVPPNEMNTAVRNVIKRNLGQVKYCYERRLKDASSIKGRIDLSWRLVEGTVENLTVVANTTGDDVLVECIKQKMVKWQFPQDLQEDVSHSFTFE